MALPEAIPVRYTEEEAGYVTLRPVVRQTFRLHELLDMVLTVTGKDVERIRQILHSGTVVYHSYRYWWEGLDADHAELISQLARFPDPDPSRAFQPENCTHALLVAANTQTVLEIERAATSRRRLLQRRSAWDAIVAVTNAAEIDYAGYSYAHKADLFALELMPQSKAQVAAALQNLAPRNLRFDPRATERASRLVFVCPRKA
jgi:hypothetical protein